MKINKSWLAVLAAVAALITAQTVSAGSAHSRYKVADLGTLPGYVDSYVWQNTLNNRGHVGVYANNDANPEAFVEDVSFLWKGPGEVEVLPWLPGSTLNTVWGLNDLDQAVGVSVIEGYAQPVLWERRSVQILGKLPGGVASEAFAINNAGVVVGDSWNQDSDFLSAVCWFRGKALVLPPLEDAAVSQAYGINDWGQMVGWSGSDWDHAHAVLWPLGPNAGVVDLGTLGGDASWATGINNRGDIVGQAQTPSGDWHCTVWHDGRITDLLNFGDDPLGSALSINNRGQIVGFSGAGFDDVSTAHALLWENGRMINLQTQIPADSGWVLQQALGINDRGQIVGFGLHKGKIRAYLLTPIDPQR